MSFLDFLGSQVKSFAPQAMGLASQFAPQAGQGLGGLIGGQFGNSQLGSQIGGHAGNALQNIINGYQRNSQAAQAPSQFTPGFNPLEAMMRHTQGAIKQLQSATGQQVPGSIPMAPPLPGQGIPMAPPPPVPSQRPAAMMYSNPNEELAAKFASGQPMLHAPRPYQQLPMQNQASPHEQMMSQIRARGQSYAHGGPVSLMDMFGYHGGSQHY